MPRAPKRFRISAKNYFLTFPQCTISKEEAIPQLQSLPYPVPPKYIRVAQETHQDGNLHLHCLIQFEGKYQCTNNRFFDLLSTSRSGHFHPNIQGARSSTDVNTYISKHGDFIEWGSFQIDGRSARGCTTAIGDAYAEALNSTNKEAALRVIKEKDPKNYVLHFRNINASLDSIFVPVEEPFQSKWDPLSFNVPNDMKQWAEDNVLIDAAARPDRPISLILEGESRLGKTAWARSLGPHNFLSGHLDFSSKSYSNNALYNIIDDVSPKYLTTKHWKELIGAKHDWQANCRYSKPVQIKGGIPAIVLCKPGADSSYKEFLDRDENKALKEWTLKNAQFEFITEPMFSAARRAPPTPVQEEEEL